MSATHQMLPRRMLKPGELLVLREPCLVITILGSCLAVTFFHRATGLAAICHAMLSEPPFGAALDYESPYRFRYLSLALDHMWEAFKHRGVAASGIEVKMFGGAAVTNSSDALHCKPGVGQANILFAKEFFAIHDLNIRAANTGGLVGRKIEFNTVTGCVLHRHLTHPGAPGPSILDFV